MGIISEYLKNKHRSRFVDEIMTIKKTSSIDFVGVGLTFTRSIDDIKIKVKIPPPGGANLVQNGLLSPHWTNHLRQPFKKTKGPEPCEGRGITSLLDGRSSIQIGTGETLKTR